MCYTKLLYVNHYIYQFSRSVVSDSLRPHESQLTRPPCPSPTPWVHSDSCPSSQWCHPAISSSRPLLLLPPIPPSIRVFSNESTFRMRWPKYWSFSFSIIPSKEIPGLISFRISIIVKIFRDNWKIMASFPSPEFAWHGIIKCHLASGVSLVINREFLSVSHTPLPPRSPVYIFKDLAWR